MKGLKPTPVLKECKISTGSIGRWQAGSAPNSDAVIALAEYLNCSTDLLLTGKEYVKPGEPKPLSQNESDMLSMFRSLPGNLQDMCFAYMRSACDTYHSMQEEEKRLLGQTISAGGGDRNMDVLMLPD